MSDHEIVIAEMQSWLQKVVIGLNLCPFAKAVFDRKQIRYRVSEATTKEQLLRDLVEELIFLRDEDSAKVDTTLLIHPDVMNDFLEYNEFLDVTEVALQELKLEGVIQIASFHPQYQFAGTELEDISNYTNRAPYPTLHLLREASVTRAVDSFVEADSIPEKNIATLNALGLEGWKKLGIASNRKTGLKLH